MSDYRRWRLSLMLHTSDGRTGVVWVGEPGGMYWDREGEGETTKAVFKLFFGDELMDEHEIDGDDWRELEVSGSPLTDILKWASHPQMSQSLAPCVTAALMGCDPDGWTDAHEQLLNLMAEQQALRTIKAEAKARAAVLAHRLKQAAFASGCEEASPANAWTRQEKTEAKSRQVLAELLAAIEEI